MIIMIVLAEFETREDANGSNAILASRDTTPYIDSDYAGPSSGSSSSSSSSSSLQEVAAPYEA